MACDAYDSSADPDGHIEVCDGTDGKIATIGNAYNGAQMIWFNETVPLAIFNAGTIDVSGSAALDIMAPEVTYQGNGGFLRSDDGYGIGVIADGPVRIWTSDHIDANTGISVGVLPETPASRRTFDVRLEGSDIVAHQAGIQINAGSGGTSSILIDANSSVTASGDAQPVAIFSNAEKNSVILAGAILGSTQVSALDGDENRLELQPEFTLEGRIDVYGASNELVFGGAGSETFDLGDLGPKYSGFNRFSKTGTSVWTLDGNAAQRFDINIETGTVIFTGSLDAGGRTQVSLPATLSGAGTLDDLVVWGTISPSGTLYAGDVVFHPNSILEIDTRLTEPARLEVASAVLGGATVRVIPSAGSLMSYEILVSDTPFGDGDSFEDSVVVTTTTPRYLATLDYTTNSVIVTLQQSGVTFSSYARTPEQAAVAALLDALGPQAPYYEQLDVMSPEDAADLLEQMSGSEFAATTGALLQNASALTTASLGRIQQQAGGLPSGDAVMGYAAFSDQPWTDGLYPSVWGRLIAGTSTIGGATSGSAALIGGADVQLGNDLTLGLLAGIGSSSIASGNTMSNSVDLSAGLYGAQEFDGIVLRFGASMTHHDIDSTRTVSAPGVNETLTASYGAATIQAFAEIAREFDFGAFGVEPFANLGYARHFSPGFTETGGAGALTVAASTSDALDTTVGVRVTYQVALGDRLLTTGATAGWKQRFSATPSTINSLSGSAPFEVAGTSTAGAALLAGIDMRLDLDARTGLELAYNLEWSGSGVAHAASGRYAKQF